MLTRSGDTLSDDAAQPDQVARGPVIGVRHPDGRQLSGPMKTGQHGGVTTVCLHPSARLHRNQRRQLLHRRQMFLCHRQQVLGEALDQGILAALGFLLEDCDLLVMARNHHLRVSLVELRAAQTLHLLQLGLLVGRQFRRLRRAVYPLGHGHELAARESIPRIDDLLPWNWKPASTAALETAA